MEEAMAAAEKDKMELARELDVVQEEPKNQAERAWLAVVQAVWVPGTVPARMGVCPQRP